MDQNHTYYETLISRYLSGEATGIEITELAAWIRSDDEHMRLFTGLRKAWALNEAARIEMHTNLDKEWASMAARTGLDRAVRPVERRMPAGRRLLMVAAVILLLLAPALLYMWYFTGPAESMLVAGKHVLDSTLPDGTQISLNAGSSLLYPSRFRGAERKVVLQGEAYFDVTRNASKTFVIDAEDLQIRVLGTSFYVNTESIENTMEVVLISGSLRLDYSGEQMLLDAGEKAVAIKENGSMHKQAYNDPNLLAWKTRKLFFDNTPLGDIVKVLEKVYQKEIVVLNPEILNCRITATFDGEPLEAVIVVLQSTIDLQVRPNGNALELSGRGCQ
jgi:transmembrane sensor